VESGVYVIPAFDTLLRWHGVVFIHDAGEYISGSFKFVVHLPETYPSEGLPRVQFETKIFHPMIHSSSGELDIKPAKFWEKRDPTKGYMDKLLRYVKEIFFFHEKYWKKESKGVAGFKLCANPTAARMYIKDHQRYRLKCQESVKESLHALRPESDEHSSLRFGAFMDDHEVVKEKIIRSEKGSGESYLQWFSPGVNGKNFTC